MTYTVQRWGNSLAVRIPRHLARGVGLQDGSAVELRLEDRRIVIEPLVSPPTLDGLLAGVPVTLWSRWTPGRGDLIRVGTENAERRPALVLSPAAYSARTGFASVCPIEARARANGFAVELPRGSPAQGVVLADRVTAVDVRQNRTGLLGSAPDEVVAAVLGRVAALLGEIPDT